MAAQTMAEKRIGSLLVLAAGEMVGIMTETDVVRKVIASHLPASSTHVGAVMNYPLIQIDLSRTVRDASQLMAKERIRHLAVTEDNTVVGLVSVRDLVKMVSVRDQPRFLRSTSRSASPSPPRGVGEGPLPRRANERPRLDAFPPFRDRPSPVATAIGSHVIRSYNYSD